MLDAFAAAKLSCMLGLQGLVILTFIKLLDNMVDSPIATDK